MISVMATVRVCSDKAWAFEQAFAALAQRVRLDEPGNVLYQLYASRSEPYTYRVLELYRDDEDLHVDRSSSHVQAAAHLFGSWLKAAPSYEILDSCV